MTYVIALILLVLSMSKKSKLFTYLLLIFMCILVGFNYWNIDWDMYVYIYHTSFGWIGENLEVLYIGLNRIFLTWGIRFEIFWFLFLVSSLLLVYRAIHKYASHQGLVLSLYFIYPFFINGVQIRNFMAMGILINAIPLLSEVKTDLSHYLKKFKKLKHKKMSDIVSKKAVRALFGRNEKKILLYALLCLIAAGFHVGALFYLIFLVIPFVSIKTLLKWLVMGIPIVTFFSRFLLSLLFVWFPALQEDRIFAYFVDTSWMFQLGWLIYYLLMITIVLVLLQRFRTNPYQKKITKSFAETIVKANILVFVSYPLIINTIHFIRLLQNITVLNYILFVNALYFRKEKLKHDILLYGGVLFVMLLQIYFVYTGASFDGVVRAFFEYNRIFR